MPQLKKKKNISMLKTVLSNATSIFLLSRRERKEKKKREKLNLFLVSMKNTNISYWGYIEMNVKQKVRVNVTNNIKPN